MERKSKLTVAAELATILGVAGGFLAGVARVISSHGATHTAAADAKTHPSAGAGTMTVSVWIAYTFIFSLAAAITASVLFFIASRKREAHKESIPAGRIFDADLMTLDENRDSMRQWANNSTRNRLLKLGDQADYLFTPLQLEAFLLAKRIGKLVQTLPKVSMPAYEGFLGGKAEYARVVIAAEQPFRDALTTVKARYARDLAPEIKRLVLSLQIEQKNKFTRGLEEKDCIFTADELVGIQTGLLMLGADIETAADQNVKHLEQKILGATLER